MIGGIVDAGCSRSRWCSTCPPCCSGPSPTTPARCRTGSCASDEQFSEKLNLGGLVNDQNRRAVELHQRRRRARKLRYRTGHQGHRRLAEHPGRCAGRPEVVARQGRSDRLLGLLLHQLPARDPARRRLVRQYNDAGLEVIGVHTPEYAFEKVQGNVVSGADGSRHHLPGRARQQPVDLDQLPQPVLARRISDRRERARSATSSSARATTTSPRT